MKKKNGNQAAVLGVCCTLLVCAAIVAAAILLREQPEVFIPPYLPPVLTDGGIFIATADNLAEITDRVRENVERGMFATYMTTTWTFQDGHSPSGNAVKGNSSSNNYPFWFTVTEQISGDIVFTSGLLPVGTQLSEIVLDTPLPAGEYDAIMDIHMVDDDGEFIDSDVGFGLRIVVLN